MTAPPRWSRRSRKAISDGERLVPNQRAFARDRGRADAAREKAAAALLTCGSVDDGKSTLIGRLLFDSAAGRGRPARSARPRIRKNSARTARTSISRCWSTGWRPSASRASPSTSPIAISPPTSARSSSPIRPAMSNIPATWRPAPRPPNWPSSLIDARKGILPQTRRHAFIVSMLGMRARRAGGQQDGSGGFRRGASSTRSSRPIAHGARSLALRRIVPIPLWAREGDNIAALVGAHALVSGAAAARPSGNGRGRSATWQAEPFRFPVQWVNRPEPGFPRLCRHGREPARSGSATRSPSPSRARRRIARIVTAGWRPAERAAAGQAVTLTLADEIDVSRGDVLCDPQKRPEVSDQFAAHLLWMAEEELHAGPSYHLKLGTATVPATISSVQHLVDVNTLGALRRQDPGAQRDRVSRPRVRPSRWRLILIATTATRAASS